MGLLKLLIKTALAIFFVSYLLSAAIGTFGLVPQILAITGWVVLVLFAVALRRGAVSDYRQTSRRDDAQTNRNAAKRRNLVLRATSIDPDWLGAMNVSPDLIKQVQQYPWDYEAIGAIERAHWYYTTKNTPPPDVINWTPETWRGDPNFKGRAYLTHRYGDAYRG